MLRKILTKQNIQNMTNFNQQLSWLKVHETGNMFVKERRYFT